MVTLFLSPDALGSHPFTLSSSWAQKHLTASFRYNYETGEISPDVVEQTEQTILNIEAALTEAGSSIKEVVRVRYILPQKSDFPKCWPVLRKWFGDVRPAATMIQGGLMEEIMRIEIEVTAKKSTV
jgi:enamine deaminase RidA (YjgF/YER057c/UK114 family)